MLPSHLQWKKWSLISKYTAVGLLVGIASLIITVYLLVFSQDSNSYDNRLLEEQNPTKLVIQRVELVQLWGSGEPYVVIFLKNTSKLTALNVKVGYIINNEAKFKLPDGVREKWNIDNLAINPGEEGTFPIAPLSEYISTIFPENPTARLIKMASENKSFSFKEQICEEAKQDYTSCNYKSTTFSSVIKISYKTIFDKRKVFLTQYSNTFLKGFVNAH